MRKPTHRAIVSPLGLALVLAIGIGTVVAIAVFWSVFLAEQALDRGGTTQQLAVRADGTPLVYTYRRGQRVFRTIDGRELPVDERVQTLTGAALSGPRQVDFLWTGLSWRWRINGTSDLQRPAGYWYFVHDGKEQGRGYFQGFDSDSKLPLGFIGERGFRTDVPPADERFPVSGRLMRTNAAFGSPVFQSGQEPIYYGRTSDATVPAWVVHLISNDRLVEVDFRKRSVRTLLERPGMMATAILSRALPRPEPKPAPPGDAGPDGEWLRLTRLSLALRLPDQVLVIDPREGKTRAFAIPEALRSRHIVFYALGDDLALASTWYERRAGAATELWWFDDAGKVVRQADLTEVLRDEGYPFFQDPDVFVWIVAFAMPTIIPGLIVVVVIATLAQLEFGLAPDAATALFQGLTHTSPVLLLLVAVSAVMGWLAYRRQKRYALPWAGIWAAFVFLGGVPGYVAYRFHRPWPVLRECPACRVLVPRDRESCAACAAEFPAPEPKGIEVFA